jgi:hypothetical protein
MCLPSFAQKIKFTNNTNTWSMIDSTIGCCIPYVVRFTTAHYDGRDTVNGLRYQRLYYDFGSCLVREDQGRVYVIGNVDSTERVLYDFNLELNDTIHQYYEYDIYTSWVSSMDSTQLFGIWYKVWHFDGMDTNVYTNKVFTYQYNVIEGIGCTNGVYYPAAPYDYSAYSDQLLCFHNDMGYDGPFSKPVTTYAYDYTGSFDNDLSCAIYQPAPHVPPPADDQLLSTTLLANSTGKTIVTPNPVTDASIIVFPSVIRSGTIVVLNELGQTISNSSFQNARSMPVGNKILTPGNYFYRVTDLNNGKAFTGKITKL